MYATPLVGGTPLARRLPNFWFVGPFLSPDGHDCCLCALLLLFAAFKTAISLGPHTSLLFVGYYNCCRFSVLGRNIRIMVIELVSEEFACYTCGVIQMVSAPCRD
jgi:hypothetical protein